MQVLSDGAVIKADDKRAITYIAMIICFSVVIVLAFFGTVNVIHGINVYRDDYMAGSLLNVSNSWITHTAMPWILTNFLLIMLSAAVAHFLAILLCRFYSKVSRAGIVISLFYGGFLAIGGGFGGFYSFLTFRRYNPANHRRLIVPDGFVNPGIIWLMCSIILIIIGALSVYLLMRSIRKRQVVLGRQIGKIAENNYRLYILLAPALVTTLIFSYVPMYGVTIAFRDFSTRLGIMGSPWVGLTHIERFVTHPFFWPMLWNTAILSLYGIALFPLSIIFALLLNELRNLKFKKVTQTISYAPFFLSVVVVISIVSLLFDRGNGIINNLLEMAGKERYDFMTSIGAFRHLHVWSAQWQGLGFGAIIYLAALSSISPELVEAAIIDGANRPQIIRHINIPSIMPTIIILFILAIGGILTVGIDRVLLLHNDLNISVARVIPLHVYNVGIAHQNPQFSYAAAMGLFNSVVNFFFLIVANTIAKRVTKVSLW